MSLENKKGWGMWAGELPKEPLTIPSIVCQAQYENLEAFVDKAQNDGEFLKKWFKVEKKNLKRKRKKRKELIILEESVEEQLDCATWSNKCAKTLICQRTIFRKLKYI